MLKSMRFLILLIFVTFLGCSRGYLDCGFRDDSPNKPYKCGTVYTNKKIIEKRTKDFLNFYDFKKGEVIADIGASSGYWEGIYSVLCDSLTFYIQDIDSSCLNQTELTKIIDYYSKIKNAPITNKFKIVIGNEESTKLPDGIFDKIIMNQTFHHLDKPEKIVKDLSKKIKPNGQIFISDGFSTETKVRKCADNPSREYLTINKIDSIFKACGFKQLRIKKYSMFVILVFIKAN